MIHDDQPIAALTHRGDAATVLGPGPARLLVFVPAAFTPVCDSELRALGDLAVRAEQLAARICVVSCDTPASLAAWLRTRDPSGRVIGFSDHWPHGLICARVGAFDVQHGTALRRSWAVRHDGSRMLVAASAPGEARAHHDHVQGLEWAAARD